MAFTTSEREAPIPNSVEPFPPNTSQPPFFPFSAILFKSSFPYFSGFSFINSNKGLPAIVTVDQATI